MTRTLNPGLRHLWRRPGSGRTTVATAILVAAGLVMTGCSSDSAEPVGQGTAGSQAGTDAGGNGGPGGAKIGPKGSPQPSWMKNAQLPRPALIGGVNKVAQATVASVKVFRARSDSTPWMTLKNPRPSKAPLVFLVQEQADGWLRVMLPVRPNQSQGWIRASDVKQFQHDYRMVISIGAHTLKVFKDSTVLMTVPVGLGTATTPTPGGVYFTEELLKPTDPKGPYGPYAYGLSGYSTVLNEFMGGDGQIGIHGTNDPAGIGKSVSHGCIRMSNASIQKLATMLPIGVPVQVVG